MKKKYYICLSFTLTLMAFLVAMSSVRRQDAERASRIAPEILRFHVLANSDSSKDQALKLEVKDLLLNEIQKTSGASSKEELCLYITENRDSLEEDANEYMKSRGFDYTAEILLEQCRFPEKTYGDMTFPAGTYDAVRVLIGEGQGRNFWCVLYPSLCYLDSTHAVVPDESKEVLKGLIPEDDFLALLKARRPTGLFENAPTKVRTAEQTTAKTEQEISLPRVKIHFKLFQYLPKH